MNNLAKNIGIYIKYLLELRFSEDAQDIEEFKQEVTISYNNLESSLRNQLKTFLEKDNDVRKQIIDLSSNIQDVRNMKADEKPTESSVNPDLEIRMNQMNDDLSDIKLSLIELEKSNHITYDEVREFSEKQSAFESRLKGIEFTYFTADDFNSYISSTNNNNKGNNGIVVV